MNLTEKLQTQLLPKYKGLIWITDESLSNSPEGFHALDYFLDGLLTEYKRTHNQSIESYMTLLSTQSFGSPFSLTHICTQSNNPGQDFENAINLLNPSKSEEIAMINFSKEFTLKPKKNIYKIELD